MYERVTAPTLDWRVNRTKWVVLRYPNPSMAQLASKSQEAFEDFFISRLIFCITIIYVNRNLCHISDNISVYDRLNGDTTENKRRNYHLISLPPLKSNLSESESFVAKSNNVSRRIL